MSNKQLLLRQIQQALVKHGDTKVAKQQSQYFKQVVKHYGLKAKTLSDDVFKPIYDSSIKPLKLNEQIDLACDLLSSEYLEEKSIAISILNKNVKLIVKSKEEEKVIQQLASQIDQNVYDWATCDSISSKVICELIKLKPKTMAPIVEEWKDADHMWRQRSACVSFVKIARHGAHNDRIITICKSVVMNNERFAQLGCGWVLRELSLADLDLTTQFIKDHYKYFSREGLRYAIEKMDGNLRNKLLKYNKRSHDTDEEEEEEEQIEEVAQEEEEEVQVKVRRGRKRSRVSHDENDQ
jgi:3-methyladenine DNA glycosylase AlkD